MIPTDATQLSTPIYLDTTLIQWTARRQDQPRRAQEKPADQDLYITALADFDREAPSEHRFLRDSLEEYIRTWKSKADVNRAALTEITQLDEEISTVWARVETPGAAPETHTKTELLRQLESATDAFLRAAHHATIRLKALQVTMVRRVMLGRSADAEYESPGLPKRFSTRRPNLPSKTDRRNYEVILQLELRTFRSPKQYFHEIGQRCVKGRGKPVGHATINGWFKKQGLYGGREDRDIAALQARAVARAKKELAAIQPVSPD